ncbi:MAG: methionyl-tRNA formyltransferase [Bacteroidales bacterium]|jgi:methionyl-tRNA formyltransferase|nr:methionyl-tRNA formyltransferase [Bacteroidales bacterium]MBR4454036.1 methionyl-tRNA formyltransferase [Bacteroidales bacterium]MCR5554380.1 methionyl-tRNA formyltransferase [Bacteroidales bacterium]
MRIVFMGTPEFAAGILEAVINEGQHEVCAVVTMPDKAAGRGMKIQKSAVKQCAEKYQLPLLQPEKLREEQFLSTLKAIQADLFLVVAFRMLPEVVWQIPPKGTINLHASLLPDYRGAAPINWAIINGEKQTGVTTFFINEKIDQGKIILRRSLPIGEEETAGELHDSLLELGKTTVLDTLHLIAKGNVPTLEQALTINDKSAPKIFKEDCRINWHQPAEKVHDFIRGLSPYPAAFTTYTDRKGQEVMMKIFASAVEPAEGGEEAGIFVTDDKNYLAITCQSGRICIKELQIFGKKRLKISEFLLGNKGLNGRKLS